MTRIKNFILFLLLFAAGNVSVRATSYMEATHITELDEQHINISVKGSNVRIGNAVGQVLEIYNVTGLKVASYKIETTDKIISLSHLSKSCYILKIGKTVRKISIL